MLGDIRARAFVIVCVVAAFAACRPVPPSDVPALSSHAHEVSLAVFGDALAIGWYDTRGGTAAIYEQPLDASGRPAGPEQRLSIASAAAYEVDIDPIRDGFVAAWYQKDAAGKLSPALGAWTRAGERRWLLAPSAQGRNIVVRGRDALVFAAWIEDGADGSAQVWAGWWRDNGQPLRPARAVGAAGRTTWNLNAAIDPEISTEHPRAWLTFDAVVGNGTSELFLVRVDDEGSSGRQLTPDDGFASTYPDIALLGDRAALTWFDERDGNQEVYLSVLPLQTLLNQGALAGARITTTPGESIGAYVAWSQSGDRLGLAWSDEMGASDRFGGQKEIHFATYDRSGKPLAPAVRVTSTPEESLIPAIRAFQSGFALAWTEYQPAGEGHSAESRSRLFIRIFP